MTLYRTVRTMMLSPFGMAALAGIIGLVASLTAIISDLVWLLGDITHNTAYGYHIIVLVGLSTSGLLSGIAVIATVKCYRLYVNDGLEHKERTEVIKYKLNSLKHKKLLNILK